MQIYAFTFLLTSLFITIGCKQSEPAHPNNSVYVSHQAANKEELIEQNQFDEENIPLMEDIPSVKPALPLGSPTPFPVAIGSQGALKAKRQGNPDSDDDDDNEPQNCLSDTSIVCDDNNDCTTELCDPEDENADSNGCVYENKPIKTPCDDGDACTDRTSCDGSGMCAGGIPLRCSNESTCSENSPPGCPEDLVAFVTMILLMVI